MGNPGTFAGYVDRERKHPFEVEHIWANHYERYQADFLTEHEFQEHRNLMGGLVLLPKDFNASYGDLPYDEKLDHYNAQNILVRSLHPLAYENNPSFRRLIDAAGLPFKPYPGVYPPAAIEERQQLYRQLCQLIWDPGAIGLPVAAPIEVDEASVDVASVEDVRSLLASLVKAGPIRTLDLGRPNWIIRIDAEDVWVETEKSQAEGTGAQPVLIEWLEDAYQTLVGSGELTIELLGGTASHRSAFIFAVLALMPDVSARTQPRRLTISRPD